MNGRVNSGKAAAASMTEEQRKERSMKAVEAKKAKASMPKATHSGVFKIGDMEISCFVLNDGRRVISGRTLTSAIGMKGRGQGAARIASHKLIKNNENNQLALAIENPIKFISDTGMAGDGYEASVLQEVCEAILTARDNGLLTSEQDHRYAAHADLLIRGFARVGIIALVDEATGYEREREKNALAKILEAFVAKELQPWLKTFPDEYYRHIFRLYKLPYPPKQAHFRPGFIGKLTNDIVYDRLAPELLPELKKAASKIERRAKLHQFLTSDVGHPQLREHIVSLITLLKISKTKEQFKQLVDEVHPRFGTTYEIDFTQDE